MNEIAGEWVGSFRFFNWISYGACEYSRAHHESIDGVLNKILVSQIQLLESNGL